MFLPNTEQILNFSSGVEKIFWVDVFMAKKANFITELSLFQVFKDLRNDMNIQNSMFWGWEIVFWS